MNTIDVHLFKQLTRLFGKKKLDSLGLAKTR